MISDFKTTFLGPVEYILDLAPRAGVTDLRELGRNERQIEALRLMVNEGQESTHKFPMYDCRPLWMKTVLNQRPAV